MLHLNKINFSNRFCPTITGLQEPESLQTANIKPVTVNNGFYPILSGLQESIKSKTSQKLDEISMSKKRNKMKFSNRFCPTITELQE